MIMMPDRMTSNGNGSATRRRTWRSSCWNPTATADINAIIRTIRRELMWRLPKDNPVTIHIDGADVRVDGMV